MALTLHLVGPISHTTHTVEEVSITTQEGDLVIYENHAPMIASLAPNHEFSYVTADGSRERKQVADGILHVERDTVTVIMGT